MILSFSPCIDNFQLPLYSSFGAAAFDIFSPENVTLMRNETVLLPLGFEAEVPENHVALLVTRSGNGCKQGLGLRNQVGVIDSDYRGEWMVKLTLDNFVDLDVKDTYSHQIKTGDRIVQCLIMPVVRPTFKIVDSLTSTVRNKGGIGSTGV